MCKYAHVMDWSNLSFVLAAARHGGLSGAAGALGVNHATVSRRIAAAETDLGVRLFDRLPTGLRPTKDGLAAIATAEAIEARVMELDTAIAASDERMEGPLVATAPQLVIEMHLAGVFAAFSRTYPAIDLTVLASNETLNLHRREADVAVRVADAPEPSLFGARATDQRRAWYGAAAYVAGLPGGEAAPDGPVTANCVGFTWWGDSIPADVTHRFGHARLAGRFDDMVALRAAVQAGMGLSRMPCFLGDPDPQLVRVPGLKLEPYAAIWVLTHPDMRGVVRVRRFMQFVTEAIRRRRPLYMGE